jgi:fused signal recognition particle receptor
MEEIAKQIAQALNLAEVPNLYDWFGLTGIFVFVFITILNFLPQKEEPQETIEEKPEAVEAKEEVVVESTVEAVKVEEVKEEPKVEVPKVSWHQRLLKGLERTRNDVWGKIDGILKSSNISEDQFEQIEEILYTSDLSPAIVAELLDDLKDRSKKEGESTEDFLSFIRDFLKSRMVDIQKRENKDLYKFNGSGNGTKVIMIVGVNGAGKTTTIGKLATKLKAQGANVVVGACDTFRAAAVEQLEVWCKRAGVEMIKAHDGADPSGVAYDTVQKAKDLNADYCIIDTAGRLHTASNLMDELAKTKKVMSKVMEDAPHETLLVIDAITGQNALRQAEEFNKALDLTGLIFTKCDGSSKAGSAVSIVEKLNVPITYIGVGEDVDDLNVFDLDEYLDALLGSPA